MENNQQQKLGKGIVIISIIQLISYVFTIFNSSMAILKGDINQEELQALQALGIPTLSKSHYIITIIISLIFVLGIILILFKKALGVYTYFTCVVVNVIYSIIMFGFQLLMLIGLALGLILPILMAVFIAKKKELFGFGVNINDMDV